MQLPPTAPASEVVEALREQRLRLGSRLIALDLVTAVPEPPAALVGAQDGRACVVSHLPPGMTGSLVVSYFRAYRLGPDLTGGPRPVTMLQLPPRKDEGAMGWPAALVRFETVLDAMAAARDMHRKEIAAARIEVRHVQ